MASKDIAAVLRALRRGLTTQPAITAALRLPYERVHDVLRTLCTNKEPAVRVVGTVVVGTRRKRTANVYELTDAGVARLRGNV